ncbi:DUF6192 family protein [Streptomyces sp. SP17KL33]|nr:DUF6192 family protein [Streptomyces sp. SP17KL33]MEE1836286.1 DUF6192 family protein [Streptomyces sp. SP17KL33]
MAPAVNRIEHAIEYLDLVGACQRFVTTTGRIVPQLRDRRLSSSCRGAGASNAPWDGS